MKALSEMTLEELWQLFPIELAAHNPLWHDWAAEEIDILRGLLAGYRPVVNHIGSTAIPTIKAKPTVDILVEVSAHSDFGELRKTLEDAGYICMNSAATRMSFNKGYTPAGYAERVFHIHVHLCGDRDEILFRDYLIAHPWAAAEYEALKLSLLPRYRNNRDAYTAAKSDFVRRIVESAKGGR